VMDNETNIGPITVSQSYLIGSRLPGDTVLPVRMVLQDNGDIMVRCVGLRAGGHGCSESWRMGSMYRSSEAAPVATILTHLELFHGRR
jgi:hypothetical protein